MSNMTYEEIKNTMNPKYRQLIIDRRTAQTDIPEFEPLTGEQILLFGCDLWLNADFFTVEQRRMP